MINNNCYCVILAGGIGSRLWPSSRQQYPKQFIDFLGNGETLLQSTYKRFSQFIHPDHIIVMSHQQYAPFVREQLPDLPEANLLLEPMRRNTVPSVAWASIEIVRRNPQACMVVTPSDQMIRDGERFERDIVRGMDYVAHHDRMLALGISPSRPATNYGYIQMGEGQETDIFQVQSFSEKPGEEFAQMFLESHEFLWNTGLFIAQPARFLKRVEELAKSFVGMLEDAESELQQGGDAMTIVADSFAKCPNVSLEQGILEKTDGVDVMLCHFGWSDIGTWEALYDALPKNQAGNVVVAPQAMLYDCKDCIVKLPAGKVAVVQGLDDYMIIEEGNVLVICKKDDQSAIRKFVNDVQMNVGEDFV